MMNNDMVKKFRVPNGVNDYATFRYTDSESQQAKSIRKMLSQEGYNYSSTYPVLGTENMQEEMWFK